MRWRIVALPVAGVIIAAACLYKATQTYDDTGLIPPHETRPAPAFELYDQHKPSQRVRLASYLGRHRILLVFFNGTPQADENSVLMRLRDDYERLRANDVKVIAVTAALPQENRKAIARVGQFPFPLLSNPGLAVHRAWGRLNKDTGQPREGVFLIDRAGRVAWSDKGPVPLPDPGQVIDWLTARTAGPH